jgi:DNA polymerase III delta prime subunit
MKKLWVESYRPNTISEYVFKDDNQREQVEYWVKEKSIPHIILSGSAGTGKTTLAKALVNELDIDPYDFLEINASKENSVDIVRERLSNFVSTMPFGTFKIVLMDECLDESTLVRVLRQGVEQTIQIKDLDESNDLVKSYNITSSKIEWKPFIHMDKGIQDAYEIELENGEVVICTPSHKWYVEDHETQEIKVVRADELYQYNHILSP